MATITKPTVTTVKAYLIDANGNHVACDFAPATDSIELAPDPDWVDAFKHRVKSMTFKFKLSRNRRISLLQMIGRLRKPKLTYKTIKRNCAKRNR